MRVRFVVTEYPSRSQTFVQDQIDRLRANGHTVDVVADRPQTGSSGGYEEQNVTYLWDERPSSSFARVPRVARSAVGLAPVPLTRSLDFRRYGREVLSGRTIVAAHAAGSLPAADATIAHFGPNGLIAELIRDVSDDQTPLVVVFHGYDLTAYLEHRLTRRAYGHLLNRADLCLPVSRRWRERLVELGADEERTRIHHVGVDIDGIRFEPDRRRRHGPLRVASIARLTEKKGIEYGLRAIAHLGKTDRDIVYSIAGDGELRFELEALATSLGVDDRVRFLGWVKSNAIRRLLVETDVLVAPSVRAESGDEEGIPVSLMEAMAAGAMVVATRHSGIGELVQHDTNGLLVDERNPAQLAEAIMRGSDEHTRQRFVMRARQTVEMDFNAAVQHRALEQMLHDLTGRWHAPDRP